MCFSIFLSYDHWSLPRPCSLGFSPLQSRAVEGARLLVIFRYNLCVYISSIPLFLRSIPYLVLVVVPGKARHCSIFLTSCPHSPVVYWISSPSGVTLYHRWCCSDDQWIAVSVLSSRLCGFHSFVLFSVLGCTLIWPTDIAGNLITASEYSGPT